MTHETIIKEGFWRLTGNLAGAFDEAQDLTGDLLSEIQAFDCDGCGDIQVLHEDEAGYDNGWFSYQY